MAVVSRMCEDCDAEPVAGFTRCAFHLERGPERALAEVTVRLRKRAEVYRLNSEEFAARAGNDHPFSVRAKLVSDVLREIADQIEGGS